MQFERVPLDQFSTTFGTSIGTHWTLTRHSFTQTLPSSAELSSVALGGKVESCSDEFFAEAFQLILVEVSSWCLVIISGDQYMASHRQA